MTSRLLAVGGAALLLTVSAGIALRHTAEKAPAPTAQTASPTARLESFVAKTRQRLDRVPGDWPGWAELGMAYVQLARVGSDPGNYALAETALARSLSITPAASNAPALTGQAALAAARHDFTAAVGHARSAVRVDAYSADAYGALADGLIELGRYPEGFAAIDRMMELRPDTSSYGRASYAAELRGQTDRASALMEQAREFAADPAELTFALQHLAELDLGRGDLDGAAATLDGALARFPGHPPLVVAHARLLAARGETARAIEELRPIVARLPLPAYATLLGTLLATTGAPEEARQQFALVDAARRLGAPDIDTVLFEADHGDPARAVRDARELHRVRGSIGADDALAWALHSAGQDAEALRWSDRALRLGTRDAMLRHHRAMIHEALGHVAQARADLAAARAINPSYPAMAGGR
ncbi:tetratricopeptide (TPR) repeat protein [Allocatelliglobosispora scoriae]|uniref:Tetratricopeptide (TPR) repeat protein n=1 Tax=Allocatelliglobosispora scoriae TaxID=643052 RepID=A0A841BW09_9ACTN|nr:tetratricopeptide repeat protein [Allocatelliglobosispora scoriae]MBB5873287.1 tetratricopeptide (TPR) repeat protein [Allocatelliglobosispora scoriae]